MMRFFVLKLAWLIIALVLCSAASVGFSQETQGVLMFTIKGAEPAEDAEPAKDAEPAEALSAAGEFQEQGEAAKELDSLPLKVEVSVAGEESDESGALDLCESCGLSASISHTDDEFDDREKLLQLLNAHCAFPSKEDLLSTVQDAQTLLADIAQDDGVLLSVRSRAVRALGYFDDAQIEESMRQSLRNSLNMPRSLLVNIIRAYATMAGERGLEVLRPYMEHEEHYVRISTINAIGNIAGSEAEQVLRTRLHQERNEYFKKRIERVLRERTEEQGARGGRRP
ncbi:MAG: HEAT repeat domain-containing protein [Bradymonadia bacterium]|jgi:hypothetical protein